MSTPKVRRLLETTETLETYNVNMAPYIARWG